jgi:hypothetical protein
MTRRRSPAALPAALAAVLLLLGAAAAEGWTVQTVALRDPGNAEEVAAALLARGFDAYTEAVVRDGQRFVRVRAGCYRERDGAEALAGLLRGWLGRQGVVVPGSPGAPVRACVHEEVGFLAPEGWRQRAPGVPSFEVAVDGVRGLIRYQGGRWQVLQAPATEALAPREASDHGFAQADGTPRPFVSHAHPDGRLLLCPGTLLAEAGDAAIVQRDGRVVACRVDPPGDGPAPAAEGAP